MHKVISTVVHTFTIQIMHTRFKYVLVNGMMIPINNRTVEWNILRLTEIAGYGLTEHKHTYLYASKAFDGVVLVLHYDV